MVALPKQHIYSEAEYLEMELIADHRSEYWSGSIVAMSGSSSAHNEIIRNITQCLATQLNRYHCRQYFADTRLFVDACRAYFYPDTQIVCGKRSIAQAEAETLLNPTVVVEVLSKSTEAVDRGSKFECYRTIPSLQVFVLIDQYACAIDVHTRQSDGSWLETFLRGTEAVMELKQCGVSISLSAIYEGLEFEPHSEGAGSRA